MSKEYRMPYINLKYNEELKRLLVRVDVEQFVRSRVVHELVDTTELVRKLEHYYKSYYENKVGIAVRKYSVRWERSTGELSDEELDKRIKKKIYQVVQQLDDKMKEYLNVLAPKENFVLKCTEELNDMFPLAKITPPKDLFDIPIDEITLEIKIDGEKVYTVKREEFNRYRILNVDCRGTKEYLSPVFKKVRAVDIDRGPKWMYTDRSDDRLEQMTKLPPDREKGYLIGGDNQGIHHGGVQKFFEGDYKREFTPIVDPFINRDDNAFKAALEYEINCRLKYDKEHGPSISPKVGERMGDFAERYGTAIHKMKMYERQVEDFLEDKEIRAKVQYPEGVTIGTAIDTSQVVPLLDQMGKEIGKGKLSSNVIRRRGTFFITDERYSELVRKMIEQKVPLSFRCSGKVEIASPNIRVIKKFEPQSVSIVTSMANPIDMPTIKRRNSSI
jgi:hypothetical protein